MPSRAQDPELWLWDRRWAGPEDRRWACLWWRIQRLRRRTTMTWVSSSGTQTRWPGRADGGATSAQPGSGLDDFRGTIKDDPTNKGWASLDSLMDGIMQHVFWNCSGANDVTIGNCWEWMVGGAYAAAHPDKPHNNKFDGYADPRWEHTAHALADDAAAGRAATTARDEWTDLWSHLAALGFCDCGDTCNKCGGWDQEPR